MNEAPLIKEEIIKESFTLSSEKNRKFTLELYNYHSSILIYAFYQGEIKKEEYEKSFSMNELISNKYLSLLESIDEIYLEIINIFKKKLNEIKVFENTNQLIINLPLEGIKIKEIILNLEEKARNNEEEIKELYEIISKLKKENRNLKENLEFKVKEIERKCPFPIGSVYTQYPDCKEPKELWENTNWEILNFNGAFFRSIGGDSNEFGKKQLEGLPNITGSKLLSWTDSSGGGIIMHNSSNVNSSALYSFQDSNYYSFYYANPFSSKSSSHHNILGFNANRVNSIYGNSNHVTPENFAVKIWKRIE